jgi:hypothetical protein
MGGDINFYFIRSILSPRVLHARRNLSGLLREDGRR